MVNTRIKNAHQKEKNREQWLKMQLKCSNYLNRLNRLYKDNQSMMGSEYDQEDVKIEVPEGMLNNVGKDAKETSKVALEREKNNSLLNNKLIIQQAEKRSQDREAEKLEGLKHSRN